MSYLAEPDDGAFAAVLADGLRDVAADLCTIDAVDLVSFVRLGSFPAIEDLVQSSAELFFRHGSLLAGWTAAVELAWDSLPLVKLGLEFRHPLVSVFFDLLLGAGGGEVAVRAVLFEEPVADRAVGVGLLARAVAEARLPRRAPSRAALGLVPSARPGPWRR